MNVPLLIDPNGVVTRILRENVIVFIHQPDSGLPFTSVAWPGYAGIVTGMNAAGLSLACQLIRYGIDFVLVEKNDTFTPFSKAKVVG